MHHHTARVFHKLGTAAAKFYIRNPHKIPTHAKVVSQATSHASVHVKSLVWRHGPTIAKHTTTFMTKAARKGLRLFS